MITKRIIPCLDVRNGRVVKGTNFQGLRDVSSPVELGQYYSANGADELVSDPSREPRIRVVFNGADAAGRPLIASMAVEKGILANIVAASTRGLDGKVYGSMLLGIPGGPEQVREAIDYLQSVSNVIVEEA